MNDYRLIRQDQIQRLEFPSRNTAQQRLRKLWEHGFLRRRFLPVRGGIQTSPILYEIDQRGAELLRAEFDYTKDSLRLARKEKASLQFIFHTLGLSETRLASRAVLPEARFAAQDLAGRKIFEGRLRPGTGGIEAGSGSAGCVPGHPPSRAARAALFPGVRPGRGEPEVYQKEDGRLRRLLSQWSVQAPVWHRSDPCA